MAQLSFDVPLGGELHGFIGYFEAVLYDDVLLSTRPAARLQPAAEVMPLVWPAKPTPRPRAS